MSHIQKGEVNMSMEYCDECDLMHDTDYAVCDHLEEANSND